MMGPFDWAEDDDFDEDEDYFTFYDPMSGLFTVVERIREYVQDPEVTRREIEAVQAYIDGGIAQFERLLGNHAAFDEWLAGRSEDVA